MAENQHVNKIVYGNTVLIDLTADTVTDDKILASYTAHDASGNIITGTCDFDVNSQDATVKVAEMLIGKTAYARGTKLTGTLEPSSAIKVHSKTVTPKTTQQTILPDEGYDYLAQVTVNPIPYVETDNSAGGKTVTIAGEG